MKITADTNILVRAATSDDPVQSPVAQTLLRDAEIVAIALPALCEFCWVLERAYGSAPVRIAAAIRLLLEGDNVAVDRPSVEAGLALLDAGGDFADGVIAHDGRWLGGEVFASFDRKAVLLLKERGEAALLPE